MNERIGYKKAGLAMALALAIACWCQPAAAYDLEVTAWIDGYSQLIIQGSTVQWHNISWTVPGWEPATEDDPPPNNPTILTTADLGTHNWTPDWPGGHVGEKWSTQFTGLDLPMDASDQTVGFTAVTVRNDAFISQQPSAANNYTLIVDFDDENIGGPAWYTVRLDYMPDAVVVPIPGTLALVGPSLLGLALWSRKKIFHN